MQLGSRWSVGAKPPRLPQPVLDEIALVESELSQDERARLRWTLTWLESRPVVRLDDGPTVNWKPDLGIAYRSDTC